MDKKDGNSPANLWSRRSNNQKLSLSTNKSDRTDNHDTPSAKRFGSISSRNNPLHGSNPATGVSSPTSAGGSSAFSLGTGAFSNFGGGGRTPKTPGTAFDFAKAASDKREPQVIEKDDRENRRPPGRKSVTSLKTPQPVPDPVVPAPKDSPTAWPLKFGWVIHYRPPTSKNVDYEKSTRPLCRIHTAQDFWTVYTHLQRPSALPAVSDYHFFKEGIRPVWEDEENKRGGKWTMRLKKGVADRYWEDLLLAMIGDQFAEASEEVCGAVVSVRSGEDVFSIWTKNDGGRNVKIRETIKRVLSLPADTNLQWRSHDESIVQRQAVDQARSEKTGAQAQADKRRNTLTAEKEAS